MKNFELERIRLARVFNVFNPKVYRHILSSCVFFIAVFLLFNVFATNPEYEDFWGVAVFIIGIQFFNIMYCTKYLEVNEGCFTFSEYVIVKYRYGGFIRPKYRKRVKVEFRVDNVTKVDFSQNFVEKAFNVGRVSFEGETKFYADKYLDLISPPERFTIYGIKNFDRFKERLQRAMM